MPDQTRPGPEGELIPQPYVPGAGPAPVEMIPCAFAHAQEVRYGRVRLVCNWLSQRMGEDVGCYSTLCGQCIATGHPENGNVVLEQTMTTCLEARIAFGDINGLYLNLSIEQAMDYLDARGVSNPWRYLTKLIAAYSRNYFTKNRLQIIMNRSDLKNLSRKDQEDALEYAVERFRVPAEVAESIRDVVITGREISGSVE